MLFVCANALLQHKGSAPTQVKCTSGSWLSKKMLPCGQKRRGCCHSNPRVPSGFSAPGARKWCSARRYE
eukprot:1145025-Pelagomonas_calceolata.AAC.3